MGLKQVLELLHETSVKEGTSPPFIVGGLVRDKVAGTINTLNDIDLTTGDSTVFQLAQDFSIFLKKLMPITTKKSADGHVSIILPTTKIDFSSNFNVPGIEEILKSKGISNPTAMDKEVWSRDFTINTLLMSIDFRKIKDITKLGISDIKGRLIRTCLTPDLSFKYNVNRIIRTVYLSAKLDFDIHPDIIEWIRANPQYLEQCEQEYLIKNLNKAVQFNLEKTAKIITEMNIWDYIPIIQPLFKFYQQANI